MIRSALAIAVALALTVLPAAAAEPLAVLKPGAVVLFQGDSITDGGRWIGSDDLNHTMGQGYAYLVSAQVGLAYPERHLTFLNRGISGDTAAKLTARWQTDTIGLKPDVVSLLVGINDSLMGVPVEGYEQACDQLIADTQARLPGVKIVLGEPFVLPVGGQKADYANRRDDVERRQAAVARLGAKYHLPVVHYQAAFDTALAKAPADYWMWDGIHPTYAGHALMARTWLETVEAAWP